jgi:mannitol-specific phosphotransferase system IIBC component
MARRRRLDAESLGRAGVLVAGCTLVLTASFLGLGALVAGEATGLSDRLPVYVLGMATAFVGSVLIAETRGLDGRSVIGAAGATALGTFVILTLGGEGVLHAVRNPDALLTSQLLFYFLAAGMIATGFGYWAIKHWQELSIRSRKSSFTRG